MDDKVPVTQVTNDPFAAVRIPEYRFLLSGRFCFVMGIRMMTTLVAWWIYHLTNDPLAIGLVGLSEVIPALCMALPSGHIIDQSEKRKLLLKAISCYVVAAALLLFFSTAFFGEHFSGRQISWCIYGVCFCTGIIRAFAGPTFSSMIANIVPRQYLQNATTWTQASWLSASVTGHALGGFLIAFVGITGTFIVIVCLMISSLIFLFRLHPKPPSPEKKQQNSLRSIQEGLQFVFRTKELLGAMALDMFAVLFGGAVAMVPVYAKDILHIGPMGFGWLNAASDIGSAIIVVLLTLVPMRKAQGKKLLLAVGGFGICIIIFAFSKWFLLSFAVLMVAGMLDGVSVVIRGTVMQLKTPDHMRGRVGSVSSMFVNSSNELGQFESGLAARHLGIIPSVAFGGCMTLLVFIITWFKAPKLRKFEY